MPNLGNIRDTRLGKAYNLAEAGLRGPKPLIVDRFARYVFSPLSYKPLIIDRFASHAASLEFSLPTFPPCFL